MGTNCVPYESSFFRGLRSRGTPAAYIMRATAGSDASVERPRSGDDIYILINIYIYIQYLGGDGTRSHWVNEKRNEFGVTNVVSQTPKVIITARGRLRRTRRG